MKVARALSLFFGAACLAVCVIECKAANLDQPVITALGQVSGITAKSAEVVAFEGIPYAAPPLAELRWRPPQPARPWKGVLAADHFKASCVQNAPHERLPFTKEFLIDNEVSEDCLFLNVWTPTHSDQALLPVLFFIHGGGFGEGSGSIGIYDGTNLAAGGIVVVTINYRLGILGFMAHPELTAESAQHASGNYGLLDRLPRFCGSSKISGRFTETLPGLPSVDSQRGRSAFTISPRPPWRKDSFKRRSRKAPAASPASRTRRWQKRKKGACWLRKAER